MKDKERLITALKELEAMNLETSPLFPEGICDSCDGTGVYDGEKCDHCYRGHLMTADEAEYLAGYFKDFKAKRDAVLNAEIIE